MPRQTDMALATELRTVVTRMIKRLRKESATGISLSLTERSTLSLLAEYGQLSPGELAATEKITGQSMSQILTSLSEKGYIQRRMAEEDKRKSFISLTKKGATVLNQVRNERDSWLYRAIVSSCSAAEIDVLKQAMIPLRRIVDFEERESRI